jgi:glutathione S-transferase
MGQLPILEVDGNVMYQSLSISRFLAKKFGLAGSDDLENYEIDNAVDNINDLRASKFERECQNCFDTKKITNEFMSGFNWAKN